MEVNTPSAEKRFGTPCVLRKFLLSASWTARKARLAARPAAEPVFIRRKALEA